MAVESEACLSGLVLRLQLSEEHLTGLEVRLLAHRKRLQDQKNHLQEYGVRL